MKTDFSSLVLTSFVLLTIGACDEVDASIPGCTASLAGVQPSTGPGVEPWVAVRFHDKACVLGPDLIEGMRVSLYETEPSLIFRGDAAFAGWGSEEDGLCAIYRWPTWAQAETSWSILVTPSAPTEPDPQRRATVLDSSQLPGYTPGGWLPAWEDDGAWQLYLNDAIEPGCRPRD